MLFRLPLLLTALALPALAQSISHSAPEEQEQSALPAALRASPLAPAQQPAEPPAEKVAISEPVIYRSPSGLFSLPVPVLAELGGRVMDDTLFVHFSDEFTTHITIGVIEMDATFRWERSTQAPKDFLISVFNKVVMPQFRAGCPATKVDNVRLLPKLKNGSLYVGTLHPGFSQFIARTMLFGRGDTPPTARRGTLVFTQGDYIFVISSELGERATERSLHTLSDDAENERLRERLLGIVKRMTIAIPETAAAKP